MLGGMLRSRCACQSLTLGRPENEGVAEAELAKSCLGLGVDLPVCVAELSSRGTVPCGGMALEHQEQRMLKALKILINFVITKNGEIVEPLLYFTLIFW
ncbi:hypothetical protein Taro_017567 [Colocasia esculenta]|uniref:Uncharacterized protein n=1 Tax=Colocasia esculenta TaxID=4460 RepID=A0A843UTM3_COLES|nr:hypothetical protein [Colocasia esculenta]